MTLTQTALDREMLLVPVPTGAPAGVDPTPAAGDPRHEGVTTDTRPASASASRMVARSALIVLAVVSIGMVLQLTVISHLEERSSQVGLLNTFRISWPSGPHPSGPWAPTTTCCPWARRSP